MKKSAKKKILAALCVLIALVIIAAVILLPAHREQGNGPEIISKRAKISVEVPVDAVTRAETPAPRPAKRVEEPARAAAPAPEPAIKVDIKARKLKAKPASKKAVKKKKPAPVPDAPERARLARQRPWAVNVASFTRDGEAEKLASRLRGAGYNSYTTEFTKNGRLWHRVRVGFYRTREAAKKAGGRIRKRFRGQSPWIVKPAESERVKYVK